MKKPEQPGLIYVAPKRRPLTPFQREMLARAGTILSPGQQIAARRRSNRDEQEHMTQKMDDPAAHVRRAPGLHQIRVR